MNKKLVLSTALTLTLTHSVFATENPDNQVINTDKQLAAYCQYLIEQVYQISNKTPKDWQISSRKDGKMLESKVKYRVDDVAHVAECKIKIGRIAKETEFSFVEK